VTKDDLVSIQDDATELLTLTRQMAELTQIRNAEFPPDLNYRPGMDCQYDALTKIINALEQRIVDRTCEIAEAL
jgi:hypothetical protein